MSSLVLSPSAKSQGVQKQQKEKINAKGTLLAVGANLAASILPTPVNSLLAKGMPAISNTLTKDEIAIVNEGSKKVLNEITNLGQKGVEINNFTFAGINLSNIPDWLMEKINGVYATARGKNAAYINPEGYIKTKSSFDALGIKPNSIIVNQDKLPMAVFHELGHAFNFNNSSFWKSLQKMRTPAMVIGLIISLIPAFTKETKAKEGEELTKKQKFINGLRKACPALAGLSMTPILLEEGMATLRGNKWAKQVLNTDLAKKVAKGNGMAFATYAIAAVGLALTAFVTKKVKDKSDEKIAFKSQVNIENKKERLQLGHHQG